MKLYFFLFLLLASLSFSSAQSLTVEPNPNAKPIKVGNNAWFSLRLTNDTDKPMNLFLSPMKEYGAGGYEYTVTCNGKVVHERTTSSLDTNSKYEDNRFKTLDPGKSQILLGINFPLKTAGAYQLTISYFQDPTKLDVRYAGSGKAKKLAKKITPYTAKMVHEFTVK